MRYHHYGRQPIRRGYVRQRRATAVLAGSPYKRAVPLMRKVALALKLDATTVAGIFGNVVQESGVNPRALGMGGDYGLCQWTNIRKARLLSGRWGPPASEDAQIKYLMWELQNTHTTALRAVRAPGSAGQKAVRFCNTFEIPNPRYAAYSRRIQYANACLAEYRRTYGG